MLVEFKNMGVIKKKHSNFYIGLYGQNWIDFMAGYWNIVEQLMKINSNKLEYYRRGLKAMELIMNAS
jgi:hypothetical protein